VSPPPICRYVAAAEAADESERRQQAVAEALAEANERLMSKEQERVK
jgi:hypothetical protein